MCYNYFYIYYGICEDDMLKKAVVVFSGGQDSTTCLLQAMCQFDEVHAITFNYGQKHQLETEVAQHIAKKLDVASHKLVDTTVLQEFSANALLNNNIPINSLDKKGLPSTFVPGRNIFFLTIASIFAYQLDAEAVITGVCETDFSGYPDCRADFIQSMEKSLSLGLDVNIKVLTPLMFLNKAETWALADYYKGFELVRYHTLTCYNGVIGDGCQQCIACDLRMKGLKEYLEQREFFDKKIKNMAI